jgi:hypothetical protein
MGSASWNERGEAERLDVLHARRTMPFSARSPMKSASHNCWTAEARRPIPS